MIKYLRSLKIVSRIFRFKYSNASTIKSSNIFSNEAIHKSLKNKPFGEIARGWMIYNLLQFDFVVNQSENIIKWTRRLLGERATKYLLRKSLYTQFAGGENTHEVLTRVEQLNQQKIRTFLSYAAELTDENSDEKFENMKIYILNCIDLVVESSVPNEGMTAIKISPLTSFELQKKITTIIQNKYNWFTQLNKRDQSDSMSNTNRMKFQTFQSNILRVDPLLSPSTTEDLFREVSSGREDISARRWVDALNGDVGLYKLLKDKSKEWVELDSIERSEWKNLLQRVEEIGSACERKNIKMLVDAEQTFIQRTIHYLCVHFLMRKFNRDKCLVYNTYQCKLRNTYRELEMDIDYAMEEDFFYGLKMVRGAYLDEERKRAKEMNYPDPTNPSREATTEMYNRVMDLSLREVKQGRAELIVATHNKDSVLRAIREMEKLGIPKRGGVRFGQLLGMCDYVSSPLAGAGYLIYKAVPYGPVMEIIPYLIRRAKENRYAMMGADFERKVLGREVRNRIKARLIQ